MDLSRFQKLFGVGPAGALVSFARLAAAAWLDRLLGHPALLADGAPLKILGLALVVAGLGLHFWTLWTLRNWWLKDMLCTMGPFKWFRHPMYAAWITFVSLGVALFLNSWVFLVWVILLHPIWHLLVVREEKMMLENFQDEYRGTPREQDGLFPEYYTGSAHE